MSKATTRGVRVEVRSAYVEEQSSPEDDLWFFAYHVTISNVGQDRVQLLTRHWIITDGDGQVREVEGPGVVGEQPSLDPGESFEYTSACPLPTPVGTMQGTYRMVTSDGDRFDAEVAVFGLATPGALH